METNNNQQPPPSAAGIYPPPGTTVSGCGEPPTTTLSSSSNNSSKCCGLINGKRCGYVRMISAEAPILFAKACELFILELTIRSRKRYLVDIVPRDDIKEKTGMMIGRPAMDPTGVWQTADDGTALDAQGSDVLWNQ